MDIGAIVRGGPGAAPRGAGVFLPARTTQAEGSDRPVSPSPLSCFALTPPPCSPSPPRLSPSAALGFFSFFFLQPPPSPRPPAPNPRRIDP